MSAKNLFRRLMTKAFRTRSTAPIRRQPSGLGRKIEGLEDRVTPAVLYVDNPNDFVITTDQGASGLDNGDTVTWTAGAGSEHSPSTVAGLIFGADAFATISDAVTAATVGDTIRVAGGTFSELVTVNKQVFLFGNQVGDDARDGRPGDPETIVTGSAGSTSFYVTADDVVLDGFTVQGQTTGTTLGAGIVLAAGTEGSEVRNNIIQDNVVGIFLANDSATNQAIIERNLIRDNDNPGASNGTGIYTDPTVSGPTLTNILIQDNRFAGNNFTWGINLQNATNATITNNDFEDGQAARLANVDNSSFTNNDFTGFIVNPPSGFQVTGLNITSTASGSSDNVTASGNTFTNRRASAISVSGVSSNMTLTNNTVTQDVGQFAINTNRAMISLTGLAGTNNITENTITLTGTMPSGAGVNAIAVQGNFTEVVNVSRNTITGGNVDTFTGTNDSHGIGIFGSNLGLPSTPTPVFTTVNVTNNFITGWVDGIAIPNSHNARVTININNNSIAGNSHAGLAVSSGTGPVNAESNWWGSPTGPTSPNNPGGTGDAIIDPSNRVDFGPFLTSGTDNDTTTPGFQPVPGQATGEVVFGTAGGDTLVVTATGPNSGSYSLNGGAAVQFTNATSFTFNGFGGNDLLRIINPAGGLFAPSGGIFYTGGGQAADAIENLGGSADFGTYRVGPGNGDGVIFHDGLGAGPNQTITFSGLAPALDSVAEATFTVFATDAANNITLSNGLATGDGILRVAVDAFEPMDFANKTNVIIQGGDQATPGTGDAADVILVNFTEASAGLATVTVNAEDGVDLVTVQATPAGIATNVNGQAGGDQINVGAPGGSLDAVQGLVNVNAGPDGDTVNVNDQGDADNNAYTITAASVTRTPGTFGGLSYTAAEALVLNAGTGADTVNVNSTAGANTTPVTINAGGGNDTVNLGDAGDPNGLDDIGSSVTVQGDADTDAVVVNDQLAPFAGSYDITASSLTRGGFQVLQYGTVESLTLNAATGNNTVNVLSTAATTPVVVNAGAGNDLITVAGPGNTLNTILGPVTVNGDAHAAADTLNVFDFGTGTGQTYTVTATQVVRTGGPTINYGTIEQLNITTTNLDDTLNVQSTAAGTTTFVNLAAGSDTVNVSSDAPANTGTLAGLDGVLRLDPGIAAGTDTLNISESGSAAADTVTGNTGGAGTISGTVDGGWTVQRIGGLFDAINVSLGSAGDTVNVIATTATEAVTLSGNGGNDVFNVGNAGTLDPIAGPVTINGNGEAAVPPGDTLNINDQNDATDPNTYAISSTQVTRTGGPAITYGTIETLVLNAGTGGDTINVNSTAAGTATTVNAGGGNDNVVFANGVSLNGGTVDGGLGTDTIDYGLYATPVAVNLGTNAPSFVATLDGTQENPPTPSTATGTATITFDTATKTFNINVTVTGLNPADVTGFHLHRGPVGVNGPVIVNFGTAGLVPAGTGFTFTANNVPLDPLHEGALLGGITYLNFHTAAFPGGIIRGQMAASAPFAAAPGSATGTGGVSNVENVVGGSGSFTVSGFTFGDSLVGSGVANLIQGGPGNDVIVGAGGPDVMQGGAGNDILVWSNGDGSDVIDGEGDTDTVVVNGALGGPALNDQFTIGANGTRVAFARVVNGPFTLDIGTTETLTVNGFAGNESFTVNSLAGVADLTTVNLNGLDGDDTFDVTPSATVTFNVNGHTPTGGSPGDTLIYRGTGTKSITGTNGGQITGAGVQPVNFTNIEQVQTGGAGQSFNDVVNVATLAGGQDGNPNLVIVQLSADGTLLQIFFDGNTATPNDAVLISSQLYTSVSSLTVNGSDDADTLRINNPAGGLIALPGGFTYHGGLGADSLEDLGGTANSGSHTPGGSTATGFSGTLAHVGATATQTIAYTGLSPILDTVTETTFTVNGTDVGEAISLDNGTATGDGRLRVTVTGAEPVEFANKTNLVINGGLTAADTSDVITLANTEVSTGLATVTVNSGPAAGGSTAGDTVIVRSTPAGVATTVNGDGGGDLLLVEGFDATIDAILGPVTLNGNGGSDTFRVNDQGLAPAAAGFTYTLTATTVARSGGPATITYGTVETLFLDARNVTAPAGNTVNVTSTAAGTTYFVNTGTGGDTVNVSSDAPANAGNLDGIDGNLNLNTGAGTDVLNVSDLGGVARTYTLAQPGTATVLAATGVANIAYDATLGSGQLETFNLTGSTAGNNTYVINNTTATASTTVTDGTAAASGNATFTIQANALTAANTFNGNAGNDTFTLNIAAGTSVTGTGVTINGGDPAAVATGDLVVINDSNTAARAVTITYLDAPNGNVTIAGLGTTLAVNTVEDIDYNGDVSNNDTVTVVDSSAAVDPARVTPSANGALYTRNGGAGTAGEPGPDLDLSGLSSITVDGAAPTAFPGDRLVYAGPTPATKTVNSVNGGTIDDGPGGVIPVNFTNFERVESASANGFNDVINVAALPGGQDGAPNAITIRLDPNDPAYVEILFDGDTNTPGGEVLISRQLESSVNSIAVVGSTDADTLVIAEVNGQLPTPNGTATGAHSNAGSLPPGAITTTNAGIHFDGGAGADALRMTFTAAHDIRYYSDQADTANSGNVEVVGVLLVSFENLSPITLVGAGGNLLADASLNTSVTTMTVVDSGAAGDGVSTVDGDGTFEDITFSGYTTLTVRSGPGADTVDLQALDTATTLTAVTLDGDTISNSDTSADTIRVQTLPATVTANLFGGQGDDLFLVTTASAPFGGGVTGGILGPVNVSPAGDEGGNDTLAVDDANSPTGRTVLLTATTIEGITGFAGAPDITYGAGDQIETIDLVASDTAGDTINIQSTRAGSIYNVDTGGAGGGSDTVNISSDAPANAGNLNAIDGQVNLSFGAGTDTLNVSDLGDTAGDAYTLTLVGGVTELTFGDGAAAVDIRYNVDFGLGNGSLDNFTLVGSNTGTNTYTVNNTTATANNTVSDGNGSNTGNATFTIQANAVQAGATNTFNGNGGADSFAVNIAGGTTVPTAAGTTFVINGGAHATATPGTRDRVDINTNTPAGPNTARVLGFTYADNTKASGDVNVTGLGTPTFLDLKAVETVVYTGDGANNDVVTVTGTTAVDDLTVAPLSAGTAMVFLDGNPFDGPPEVFATSLPGVAGGSAGPDLRLGNLATVNGLTIDDGSAAGAGDQLYVYGTSSTNLVDPVTLASGVGLFGFGPGVLIPSATNGGRPGGPVSPNDEVVVTDEVVRFVTAVDGFTPTAGTEGLTPPTDVRVRVNIAPGDFAQPTANTPGLIVNTGDEPTPGTAGAVTDDIVALLSDEFRMQVNGGDPPPAAAPTGDRLRVVTPTEVNVFSDQSNPPNVTITSGGAFPLGFSSIEQVTLQPGNGVVNVIGDNNNPATPQADTFLIEGTGAQAFRLSINGSAPINFIGVTTLNVTGGQLDDTTAITPFATAIQPWNMVVTVDGQAGGNDRLIYTDAANLFDDTHLVATGPGAGRVDARGIGSASTDQVVRFLGTEQVTVVANPGDADALTLDLTNLADTVGFVFDPSNPTTPALGTGIGLPGNPVPAVPSDITTNWFNVAVDTTNHTALTVNGFAGGDAFALNLNGAAAGTLPIPLTVNAGTGADTVTLVGNAGADAFNNTPGTDAASGVASIAGTDTGSVSYTGVENLAYNGAGGGTDTVTVTGTAGPDSVTLTETSGAAAGTVVASGQPAIAFSALGAGSSVAINTLAGDDSITVQQAVNWGISQVNVDAGPPTANDTLNVIGTNGADAFVFDPATRTLTVTPAGGTAVTYVGNNVEVFNFDGADPAVAPGDTLTITSFLPGSATLPNGSLGGGSLRVNYQNFEAVVVGTAPTATNDTTAVDEDSSVVVDVLANDFVQTGVGTATLSLRTLPTNGTATVLSVTDPTNPYGQFGALNGGNPRQAIRYTPNPNFPGATPTGADSFVYRVTDANGQFADATVNVTVNAVNDAPVNTVPGPQTTNEDTALPIPGLSVNDIDAGTGNLTVTLSVTNGTLTGTGFTPASGSTISITGTQAAVNTALGTVTFTPAANFNGAATLTMVTSDNGNTGTGGALTDTDTVAITVNPVNDAPVNAVPGPQATNEDTALVFSTGNGNAITVSDVDAGTGPLTVTLTATNGTLTLATVAGLTGVSGNGTSTVTATGTAAALNAALNGLTYTPAANFNGSAGLTVTTSDNGNTGSGGALSDTDTVAITVNPVNDAPVANPDSATTAEDTAVTVNVRANDTDVETPSTGLTVAIATAPPAAQGTAVVNADNTITFTPAANFNGTVTFTYTVTDTGDGASPALTSSPATVTVTVTPVNDAPVNTLPAQTGTEDTTTPITGVSVADVDAGSGTVTVTLSVTNGTLSGTGFSPSTGTSISITGTLSAVNTALGTVTFTPAANFNGAATLTMVTTDNGNTGSGGPLTDTDTTTITVAAVNDAPVANPDSYTTSEETVLTVPAPGVLGNDTDVDGPAQTAALVSSTTNGVLVLNADGSFTYTPNANFTGTDSFTYQVNDGAASNNLSNIVTVTITVTAVNDAPVNTLPAQTGTEDTTTPITGVSVADVDAGTTGTVTVTLSVTNGTLSGTGFSPSTGSSITITGTLAQVNTALGTVTFTPAANFNGVATLTMVTTDNGNTGSGGALTDTDTTTITVAAVNDAPVANNDAVTTAEEAAVTFDVRTNDTDVETPSGSLTVSRINGAPVTTGVPVAVSGGTVTRNVNGTLTFTPTTDANGTFTFTYQVTDTGDGISPPLESGPATVTVTVTPVNDAPAVTAPATATTPEDTPLAFTGANAITVSDAADGSTGNITVILTATNGTLSGSGFAGNGSSVITLTGTEAQVNAALATVTYAPDEDFNGSASVAVTVNDNGNVGSGGPLTDTETIAITVDPDNDAPVANGDSVSTNEDTPVTFDVRANDTDVETPSTGLTVSRINGTAVTAGSTVAVSGGTVTVNAGGTLTFAPTANGNGTFTFTYNVTDTGDGASPALESNPATVTVTVGAVNDAPVVTAPASASTPEDTTLALAGISVADLDAGTADMRVTLSVANGTLTVAPTNGVQIIGSGTANVSLTGPQGSINAALGTLTYAPAANFNGSDALTVVANDLGNTGSGGALSDTETVAITVTAVNDAPVNTVPGPQATAEDTALAVPGLSATDTDAGAGNLTVTLSVTNGTLTATGAGVAGSGTPTVTITGTQAAVNTALGTVAYTPNANFSGSDTLTMATSDNGNTGSGGTLTDTDTVAITVSAVADAPNLSVSPASGSENTAIPVAISASLTDTDGSETLSIQVLGVPVSATFNQGTNLGGGEWRFTPAELSGLTITVPDNASFTLTVNAIATEQASGSTATTSRPLAVTVTNSNPTGSLTNNGPANEGGTTTVTVVGQSDPSSQDVQAGFRYSFDFNNDGDFADAGEIGNGTYSGSVADPTATVPAQYLDDGPGSRVVRVRIFDKDGGFSDATTAIAINNVAPTATFTASGPFIERQPVTVTFTNQSDPSSADTAAGFRYSYDFNGDGVFEVVDSPSPTATFTPPTEGTFTVRGRIKDKDGGFTDYTANTSGSTGVAVRNVDVYAVGPGPGGGPEVRVISPDGEILRSFFAYDPTFRGGVTVAVGDVTGDGIPDVVTGTGPGGGPLVKVFDGVSYVAVAQFFAYDAAFRGGVFVALGDTDGDGRLDIVTGTGDGGGPNVRVFSGDGATLKASFFAYDAGFRGGVNVGAGDVNNDGKAEIITGTGPGGGPIVRVFTGTGAQLASFFAYSPVYRGGVNVGAGDVNNDGKAEIITGTGPGGGPHLKVFSPDGTEERSIFVFGPDRITGEPLRNGFRVAAASDIDGDGLVDVIAGSGKDFSPVISIRKGTTLQEIDQFLPYDDEFLGGIFIG